MTMFDLPLTIRPLARELGLAIAMCSATVAPAVAQQAPAPVPIPAHRTPLDLVNALHAAFGEHHARAVHTKGVLLAGTFTPAPEARALTKEPIFTGGPLPIIARFSLFAGVPDLPDTDDGASPAGFAVKIKGADGAEFDLETNQHKDFIVATVDEFAAFLNAAGAAGKGDASTLQAFLAERPHAREFLASRTYPASYAMATYFGVNALKFTNAHGAAAFIRYRIVPRAGEKYLTPDTRKAQGANYLQDEIAVRVAREPIIFDWYAQVAEPGDRIEDPSVAWPDTRRMVKLGTFTLTGVPTDAETVQKTLLFLPGQPHPGVDPADPMLVLRNAAYPISLGERQ